MKSTGRPEYKPFADALRAAMRRNNLNSSQVARQIWGTTKDSRGYDVARNRDRMGSYLAGMSYPNADNLEKLAKAVGVRVEDLAIKRSNPGPKPRLDRPTPASSDLQISQVPGEPDKMHLRLDRALPWQLAMQILQMVKDAEMNAPTSSEEE